VRDDLPTGTVTFLFTDVEGSTKLLAEIGDEAYAELLEEHHRLCREAWAAHLGVEVDTEGDAFFVVFEQAADALAAASEAQEALREGPVRVRMGLHTGEVLLTETGYVGHELHRAARIASSAHGGQVVLSQATRSLLEERLPLTELGEHRLKDFPEPVSLYQLGSESFPPLKTISNTNLPRPASSFVGRELELAQVLAKIEAGARLLTLTGPGGSGKTRLALEAAATLVPEYKAGVFWVGLASLRDSALVGPTISQTLGAKNGLAEYVGERELLLLLDNLEQVIEAGPELTCLLQSCSNLTLLVTSRELLRVQGEVEYPVPPLASPEAVSLFCERSGLDPSPEIAELCARLDDLPLAVELAAARTRALAPAQILERLSQRLDLLRGGRDADPRQQTLRATIEWSYELLSEEEKALFRRLSVFAGGCTLEAAEEVADASLDTLQSLVEKSLLRFSTSDAGSRYWMLETIREYAGERLEEAGNGEAARARHAGWLYAVFDEVDPYADIQTLQAELANFRAAADWLKVHEPATFGCLVGVAWGFFWLRGPDEGLVLAVDALALCSEESEDRARLLGALAAMSEIRGELAEAQDAARECLALSRRLGFGKGEAQSLLDLGYIASTEGRLDEARTLYEESLAAADRIDWEGGRVEARMALADLALQGGDWVRAEELSRELVSALDATDVTVAGVLNNLAFAAAKRGDVAVATRALRESLQVHRLLGATRGLRNTLEALAYLIVERDVCRAALLLGASEGLEQRYGGLMVFEASVHYEAMGFLEQVPETEWRDCWLRGGTYDEAAALAQGLDACAWLESGEA
jgi:predicted ATPase/class 3 adenylate cyclase